MVGQPWRRQTPPSSSLRCAPVFPLLHMGFHLHRSSRRPLFMNAHGNAGWRRPNAKQNHGEPTAQRTSHQRRVACHHLSCAAAAYLSLWSMTRGDWLAPRTDQKPTSSPSPPPSSCESDRKPRRRAVGNFAPLGAGPRTRGSARAQQRNEGD